ncbi:hypothetical protein [Bacteroides reticulotermitis]|uniref:hypothetical protein n=1 Tax=Bacteroides reticulotermitis TaxID=1133319 RepID=UPI003A8A20F3
MKLLREIEELAAVRIEKDRLDKEEKRLLTPILSDYSMIPKVYGWFSEVLTGMGITPDIKSDSQRKKFLLIIMKLYSPQRLSGGRMQPFLRKAIQKLFSNISAPIVSIDTGKVLFYYKTYESDRKTIDEIYDKIMGKLSSLKD